MYQHASVGLSGYDEHYAEQVRTETGPRCVGKGHNGAVDESLYAVGVVFGHYNVCSILTHLNAESGESFGHNAEFVHVYVFQGYLRTCHGSHAYERAYFNHVGLHSVSCAVQFFDSCDTESV